MPSAFTHAASAIAAGYTFNVADRKKMIIIGAICSMLPDADAISFQFGIPYESMWGHRGITHSFFFAFILALTVMTIFYRNISSGKKWFVLFTYFFIATSLHPLLDAMTSGGLGVAFFAPFENSRYFFPFRPIRVSPISITRFFSYHGWLVFKSEFIVVWIPCIAWMMIVALFRKRKKSI
jgi:inner membrane protein